MTVRSHLVALIIATTLVLGTAGAGAATYSDAKYGNANAVFSESSQSFSEATGVGFGAISGVFARANEMSHCPPGTDLMAKYEWINDSLVFEFEGGPEGDVITFSNIEDKKDEVGEPTQFDWTVDQSETDTRVSAISVKFGPHETSETFAGAFSGSFSLTDDDPAISNVLFCSAEYYQVDLVEGGPDPFSSDNTYNDQNRLVQAITVSSAGVVTSRVSPGSENNACIDNADIQFWAGNQEASVTVDIGSSSECDGLTLSLVGYELPGSDTGFVRAHADDQTRITFQQKSLNSGESFTFTIDLNA